MSNEIKKGDRNINRIEIGGASIEPGSLEFLGKIESGSNMIFNFRETSRSNGEAFLVDRADAVRGHFCIARFNQPRCCTEFWSEKHGWRSAGDVIVGREAAEKKLLEIAANA